MLFLFYLLQVSQASLAPCQDPTYGDCGRCSSTDDPHILTFDDLYYDQHTDECFKYTTSCPLSTSYLPFEVCGCHYDCGSLGNTGGDQACPSNIRCIGDLSLQFYEEADSVNPTFDISIDAASNAVSSTSIGLGTVFDSANGHYFDYWFDGSSHFFQIYGVGANSFYGYVRYSPGSLEIFLDQSYFSGEICGLCGQFDVDDGSNDFLGSDNQEYLNASDVASGLWMGSISPVLNNKINEFARTYLCDPTVPSPADPGCLPDPLLDACIQNAQTCCETIYAGLGMAWENPIVDEAEFKRTWLLGCARDACALAAPLYDVVKDCDTSSGVFDYAIGNAKETAAQTYPVPDVQQKSNCTAKVCAHGDNRITLDVSYDDGATWNYIAAEGNWRNTLGGGFININPIDENTILRFTVVDVGVIGGFLATVQLCGDNGYVFEFFTDQVNTFFDVVSETPNGDTLIDEFNAFGSGPWAGHVNPNRVECMNTDADWIWNDKVGNTMVFELDFGHHIDFLKKAECYEEVIDVPTQDECCKYFSGVEDFVDVCYCDSSTTGGTTVVWQEAQASQLKAASVAAKTVGMNQLGEEVEEGAKDALYTKLLHEMNDFKTMMYTTWAMIAASLVVLVALQYQCQCQKKKKNGFKALAESDDEL